MQQQTNRFSILRTLPNSISSTDKMTMPPHTTQISPNPASAGTCKYPALTRCCTELGCPKSTLLYTASATVVALQLSVQRNSLVLSRSAGAGMQTDNHDGIMVRSAAILTPEQQQRCSAIALCRRQMNASETKELELSGPHATTTVPNASAAAPAPSPNEDASTGERTLSFSSVLGFVPVGSCEGQLLGRAATCQECVAVDGCHYCAQLRTCQRSRYILHSYSVYIYMYALYSYQNILCIS